MSLDVSTIHTALQRMVDEPDPDERRRRAGVVASEIVSAFNRQSNNTQLALSDTEEVLLDKIDQLQEQVGNNNILLSTFLEKFPSQLAASQAEIRAAVAEETARGLGKFAEDIDALKAGQVAYNARLTEMDERHGDQWEDAMTQIRSLGQRIETDESRLDTKRARLDEHDRQLAELRMIVESRPAQRQIEQAALVEAIVERLKPSRGEVEQLQAELREMRGPFSPEQRQHYVDILMRMIAEWEAAHGDGNG